MDIETMQFITPTRGAEGVALPPTPGRSKYGLPTRSVFSWYEIFFLLTTVGRAKGHRNPSPINTPRYGWYPYFDRY